MKKVLLIAALAVFGLGVSNAQEEGLKLGVTAGLPIGDAGDVSTFGIGLDVSYLWEVGDGFLVGATTGYQHFFGDSGEESFMGISYKFEYDDFQFIPLAASARYYFSDEFFAGADLGYAIGLNDGNDGGFYYRPKVGYGFGNIAVHASYAGVSMDGFTFSYIGVGIEFGL